MMFRMCIFPFPLQSKPQPSHARNWHLCFIDFDGLIPAITGEASAWTRPPELAVLTGNRSWRDELEGRVTRVPDSTDEWGLAELVPPLRNPGTGFWNRGAGFFKT